MLLGIIFIVSSFVISQWFVINDSKDIIDRPLAFHSNIFVISVSVLQLILSLSGLCLLLFSGNLIGILISITYIISWLFNYSKYM